MPPKPSRETIARDGRRRALDRRYPTGCSRSRISAAPWRVSGHPGGYGRSSRRGVIYRSLIGLGSQGLVVFEGDSVMSITKSRFGIAILVAALLCDAVEAQQQPQTITLSSLTSQGFEIKAAANYNTTFGAAQVFLQKGKDAFVCLVVLLVDAPQRGSRCSPID